MPVLFVYGIPSTGQEELESYCGKILHATLDVLVEAARKLGRSGPRPDDISCFFPKDLMSKGLGEEIIIVIEDVPLFETHETAETAYKTKKTLADRLIDETFIFFHKTNQVKCIIRTSSASKVFQKNITNIDAYFIS